jgi:hypothetical protein
MPPAAPLRVPVEIRPSGQAAAMTRCFRTARAVSEDGLDLATAVPELDGFDGPVEIAFVLPDEGGARITSRARVVEVAVSEERGAELRGVRFIALDEAQRTLIRHYVTERLGLEP